MADVEDHMWWYRALHRNLIGTAQRVGMPSSAPSILDAGCGTGGFMKRLRDAYPNAEVQGLDVWEPACKLAEERSGCKVTCASVNELPYSNGSFDAIFSADVLEHTGVDVTKAFAEAARCLKPGGVMVASVTAYEWLKSYHDERVGVGHRFTRPELSAAMRAAGLRVAFASYWNTLLFPLIVLRRKVFKPRSGESDVKEYNALTDRLFSVLMAMEHACLIRGWKFPFGVSILAVGVKNHG